MCKHDDEWWSARCGTWPKWVWRGHTVQVKRQLWQCALRVLLGEVLGRKWYLTWGQRVKQISGRCHRYAMRTSLRDCVFGLGDKVNYRNIKVGNKENHDQSKDMNSILDSVWSARTDLSQKWTCSCVIRRKMVFGGEDGACRRKDRIWVPTNAEAVGNQFVIFLFPCRVWNQCGTGHRSQLEMETLPWWLVKLIGQHSCISEAKRYW